MFTKAAIAFSLVLFILVPAFAENENTSPPDPEELTVEIIHCGSCGFRSQATAIEAELYNEFGIESLLVKGETGSFDVFFNDELIFSKRATGRFPDPGEIVQLLDEYMKR